MDAALRKHKWFVILIAIVLVVLAGASLGSAQSNEPVTLQPSFILMDEFKGGEIRRGVIYAFDGGWILADSHGLVYTCGCNECAPDEIIDEIGYLVPENTPGPHDTPVPNDTPVPTNPPPVDTPIPPVDTPVPQPAKANCGLGNGPEGADPNENACGKKTGEDNE